MSSYERNKGKLIPVTWDYICQSVIREGMAKHEYSDHVIDGRVFAEIGKDWYKIEWEVERDSYSPEFADVKVNEDGSIDFHTYHYNGGGHWTEVVEGALNV